VDTFSVERSVQDGSATRRFHMNVEAALTDAPAASLIADLRIERGLLLHDASLHDHHAKISPGVRTLMPFRRRAWIAMTSSRSA
jgi:hypothetical protein